MGLVFESALWDVLAFLSTLAAFVYHYLTSSNDLWERLQVPYIKPEFFYGNMKEVFQFKKATIEAFSEFYNHFKQSGHKFGGVFRFRIPVLIVCCPELAKDIYVKNFPHFHDRDLPYDEHFDPLSANLINLEGQKWKFLRSKLSPAFSTGKLETIFAVIREISEEYMKTLWKAADKEEMLEMGKSFALFMMDVIGAIAFGLRVNAQTEDSEFLEIGRRFFQPTEKERLTRMLSITFPWFYKTFKLKMVSDEVTNFFMDVLKETMDHRRKNNIQQGDFLHFLMKFREEKGISLSELEEMKGVDDFNMEVNENSMELTEGVVAAQAFVFFLAGYETSSTALSTCIHILADHPEVQDKILQEVNTVTKQFGDLTYEAVQSLTYVEQVLEETLRMYPPVGLIIRKCTKPYLIPGTEKIIPEGCQACLPVYSFHHDPELFPDPEEFRPERFSRENRDKIVPYSFLPFGLGPRVCIGSKLAMMEMKLSLAMLINNFKIVKCEKTKPFRINRKSFFMTPVDGLWVRLIRRDLN